MTTEPETPTQPRRRQRQEIPWKCVALEEQQIVPLRLDNGDLHPESLDESTLNNLSTLAQHNFCVHVDRVPRCTLENEQNTFSPIVRGVVSTDGFIYEKFSLDDYYSRGENLNLITFEFFLPQIQYWVRFSSRGTLTSKLDPRREFDAEHPILVVFEKKEKSLLAIEKMDDHGCGQLSIYSFHKKHLQNVRLH